MNKKQFQAHINCDEHKSQMNEMNNFNGNYLELTFENQVENIEPIEADNSDDIENNNNKGEQIGKTSEAMRLLEEENIKLRKYIEVQTNTSQTANRMSIIQSFSGKQGSSNETNIPIDNPIFAGNFFFFFLVSCNPYFAFYLSILLQVLV